MLNFAQKEIRMKQSVLLIADSGSTKTDWALSLPSGLHFFQTSGINPLVLSPEAINDILCRELFPKLSSFAPPLPMTAFFYGAGCRPEVAPRMADLLKSRLHICDCFVGSDMLGAARALLGREEGLACILGTGANSCLYDGERMTGQMPALGYVLGDEGSGAALGRLLVKALYEGRLPEWLVDTFEKENSLTLPLIINKVYREPAANRFLASLSTFVGTHLADSVELEQLVVENFREFFRHTIRRYERPDLRLHAVGSIATHFEPQLRKAAEMEEMAVGTILQRPIEKLAAYHLTETWKR